MIWVSQSGTADNVLKHHTELVCDRTLAYLVQERLVSAEEVGQKRSASAFLDAWNLKPMIMSYRTFTNYCDQKNQQGRDDYAKMGDDPLRKTLLIIDEAHLLYSPWLYSAEQPDILALQNAVWRSYQASGEDSVRVLLMTATPIVEHPISLLSLLNLLIPDGRTRFPHYGQSQWNERFRQMFVGKTGGVSDKGRQLFFERSKGLISYVDLSGDRGKFAYPAFQEPIVVHVQDINIKSIDDCMRHSSGSKRDACIARLDMVNTYNANIMKKLYFDHPEFDAERTRNELDRRSPKMREMVRVIHELDQRDRREGKQFKHAIYADLPVSIYGCKLVVSYLVACGWTLMFEPKTRRRDGGIVPQGLRIRGSVDNDHDVDVDGDDSDFIGDETSNKTVVALTNAPMYGAKLSATPSLVNRLIGPRGVVNDHERNNHGQLIRFVVFDQSYAVGRELMDMVYHHVLTPETEVARYQQQLGRTRRMCGHVGLEFGEKGPGWNVYVFNYYAIIDEDVVLELRDKYKHNKADGFTLSQLTTSLFPGRLNNQKLFVEFMNMMELAAVDRLLNERLHQANEDIRVGLRRYVYDLKSAFLKAGYYFDISPADIENSQRDLEDVEQVLSVI
jgi:hypothetical protein